MDGRKIADKFENPIDSILIYVCEFMGKYLKKLNIITPNMITTTSLVVSLLGVNCIYNKKYKLGAILYFLGYFFDCLDGNYARKYNMVSEFGDLYDHLSDMIKTIALIIVILNLNIKYNTKILFLFVHILFFITMLIHLGCQEKIINSRSGMLNTLKHLCSRNDYINYTKFVGCGTLNIISLLFIYNIETINTFF